jgi:deoxyribonuclease-4
MRMGRHMPTGSHATQALELTQEIGGDAIQIFVTNPRAWQPPAPNPDAEDAFRARAAALEWPVVAHAAYIINLASPREEIFERSISLLGATLRRAEAYGAGSVVFHIGSHTGAGEPAGLERLAQGIERTLAEAPEGVTLLLENDTGGGGKLGYRMENLATALDLLPQHAARLGVCIDISHLWGAGYDVGAAAGVEATVAEIERTIGLARVPVLHVNDAREALGSHRDVHARLGEGQIALEGTRAFLRHPGFAHTAAILETPLPDLASGKPDWEQERVFMRQARDLAGLAPLALAEEAGASDERGEIDVAEASDPATSHAQ